MGDMQDIINRIKKRRLELDMSYQDLSDKTGISKSTLQRYETGFIKNLGIDKLEMLANALGVSPAYLMGWKEKQPTELDETEIITQAAHKVGHEGPLSDDEVDKVKLAIQIALAKKQ